MSPYPTVTYRNMAIQLLDMPPISKDM